MQKKIILVATFIDVGHVDNFLYKIYKRFGVNKNNVFMFDTTNGDILLTYKIYLDLGEKVNLKQELPKTVQIHKRGSTFFTINALNRLIERDFNLTDLNINHQNYNIDWGKYKDTIVLLKNDRLDILNLTKKFVE